MSTIAPFRFGKVVTGEFFIDRDAERKRIRNNIMSSINTILISPRRWGKSSLMRQLASEIQSESIRFVFLDMYNIRSEEEFFTTWSREILKATITRREEVVNLAKKFFIRLVPVISFKVDPMHDLSLKFNWEEAGKELGEMIDLPEKVAKDKGMKIIVCIDEFQNIARLPDFKRMEETLRSFWQLHENVTYCLYGSRKHMMSDIFSNDSRPFYRFGDIIFLDRIPEDDWFEYIQRGFNETGRIISRDLIHEMIQTAANHPEYVQQLAYHAWSLTEKEMTSAILEQATEMVIDSNKTFFQEVCDHLSATQINLIKAVLQGETRFTSAEIMQKYALGTPRNVSKNKETLQEKELVDFSQDPPVFFDPFFKLWLQDTFLT